MEYTLGLLETLKILFERETWWSTVKAIIVFFMLPIVVFLVSHKIPELVRYKYKITTLALAFIFILDFPIYRSGWKINGDTLYMKAYLYSAAICIPTINITFVDKHSEWWPTGNNRTGVEYQKLYVGKYSLNNWKKALVFNYSNQTQLMLISSNNSYYLIAYPGMTELYKELIRLGARNNNDSEVK